MITMKPV